MEFGKPKTKFDIFTDLWKCSILGKIHGRAATNTLLRRDVKFDDGRTMIYVL